MKWSSALIAASCGLAAAHGDVPLPKIVGGRKLLSELRARHTPDFATPQPVQQAHVEKRSKPEKRQSNTSGQCGKNAGSCAVGYCCSSEGWCGKGSDYCTSPDCQISYGPGCDGNKKPSGVDTSSVPRPKLGNVLIGGAGIYDCVNDGEIAITFDDGPYLYTNDLLDKFKSYGAKATFFITGNNIGKGMINDPSTPYPAIIRRMHAEGHQIASHTWSHENASALTNNQFTNQMVWNEIAFNSILGFFPTYMRPPYSICAKNCQNILSVLGYHAIYFDLDTQGYLMDDPKLIQSSKNIWDKAINPSNPKTDSFLNIEHDIHYQTVYNLTDYMLASLFKHGYKSVTVGQCLGDPEANWYRAGPGGSSSSVPASTPISTPISTSTRSTTVVPTTTPTSTRTTTTIRSSTTSSSRPPTPTPTSPSGAIPITTDGQCGEVNGATCSGASFGKCCSVSNTCVDSTLLCLAILGCQSDYGACL